MKYIMSTVIYFGYRVLIKFVYSYRFLKKIDYQKLSTKTNEQIINQPIKSSLILTIFSSRETP